LLRTKDAELVGARDIAARLENDCAQAKANAGAAARENMVLVEKNVQLEKEKLTAAQSSNIVGTLEEKLTRLETVLAEKSPAAKLAE
jgi:hypothetical protein